MKKTILISLISLGSIVTMNAQWNGTNPTWTTSNVGIGTGYAGVGVISPVEKLTIGEMGGNFAVQDRRTSTTEKYSSGYKFYDYYGESASILLEHNGYFGNGVRALKFFVNGAERFRINASGFLGIGTSSPLNGINLFCLDDFQKGSIRFGHSGSSDGVMSFGWNEPTQNDAFKISIFPHNSISNQVDLFTILSNGNLGIGTTAPQEKLSVNGKIRAQEIKVEASNWPDYVFEEDYNVGTLEGLESYIKTNKHLPDMPSAKEVEKNGIELGGMNELLLKKVEELTLQLIEMNKKMNVQQKEINRLKKSI